MSQAMRPNLLAVIEALAYLRRQLVVLHGMLHDEDMDNVTGIPEAIVANMNRTKEMEAAYTAIICI